MSNWDDIYCKSREIIHAPKPTRGQPRKREQRADTALSFRITKALKAKVVRVADSQGKSLADVVNALIEKMEDVE